jgi:hypothetical protein
VGRNQKIRKHIAGHRQVVDEHLAKIALEESRPNPNMELIALWKRHIALHQQAIAKYEKRLHKRR